MRLWLGGQPGTVAGVKRNRRYDHEEHDRPVSYLRWLVRFAAAIAVALALLVAGTAGASSHHQRHQHHRHPCHAGVTPELCAHRLARSWYGWTGQQWRDLGYIVNHESGWDSCAHWPSVHHDCGYDGTVLCSGGVCSNACGIPQATPCPTSWRGHLILWRRQVHWLLRYVKRRYGTPAVAYRYYLNGGGY